MTKEQDTELEKLAVDYVAQIYGYPGEDITGLDSNIDNRMHGFIAGYKAAQERITWLETANAFHKKEAEDAIAREWELKKEVELLKEEIIKYEKYM